MVITYDTKFLEQLDKYPHKVIHARLLAIGYDDSIHDAIEGQVTGGSISISGESAIQRTCNLTIIAKEGQEITDASWAFKNKFKVEIGVENHIDPSYDDIIWFRQGTFIVKSFNKSIQANGSISVSISGMDKMCMLNGSIGGTLTSDVNFGEMDYINENGDIITEKVPIYRIIQKALQQFGGERLENIIIKDLPANGYELWTYRGDNPMYMFREVIKDSDNNITGGNIRDMTVEEEIKVDQYYYPNALDPEYNNGATERNGYQIIKIDYGMTAGYRPTELVYPGDLIVNAGGAVTTVLDNIAKMLGAYEYFYNVEGQFVFQKKENYTQEIFSPIDGEVATAIAGFSKYAYDFKDKSLLNSLSYTPAIDKIKNDFSVWGSYKNAANIDIPFHARFAIHKKPTSYTTIDDKTYLSSDYDWRELIYQMAIDFVNHNDEPSFAVQISSKNPWIKNGKTGYEHYYVDMEGFWRQLYNPELQEEDEDYDKYYHEGKDCYWNKAKNEDPNSFKFWIEFLEPGENSELALYSIDRIGPRPKVTNNSTIKTIYNRGTPEVVFLVAPEQKNNNDAYAPIYVTPDMLELFSLSSQGISAIEQVNVEFNNGACLGEAISFSTLPIYYLLPNTRIKVLGEDYLLTSISLQFGTQASMSLSGSKVVKSIL